MRDPVKIKHKAKYVESAGLLDEFECSCGWKSKVYYDGADFAYAEWKQHAQGLRPKSKAKAKALSRQE